MTTRKKGTPPRSRPVPDTPGNDGGKSNKGNKPTKGTKNGKGGKTSGPAKPGTTAAPKGVALSEAQGLNPPFDPRMRRIGSPLNQTSTMKRGWIQMAGEQDKHVTSTSSRVNFLFNPAEVTVSSSMDPTFTKSPLAAPDDGVDAGSPFYTSTVGTVSFGLLYDRTYEMFSKAAGKKTKHPSTLANDYGVFADVMAWYTYLQMYDEMPTSWEDSLIKSPPLMIMSYLFFGPSMIFYGYPTGIDITYTHWSENMVPVRAAISLGFYLIPSTEPLPWTEAVGPVEPSNLVGTGADNSWAGVFNGIGW